MTEEQLLQEARKEAEKVYPVRKMHDENMYEREAYIKGYVANAKKQMSEAVEYGKWLTADGWNYSNEKTYALFLQQQKQ